MSKSLKKNYFSAISNQLLTSIIWSAALFFISRALGAAEIGAYSYATSICSYFVLVSNLGFLSYGQREIAFLRDDKEAYSKVFVELFLLKLLISSAVIALYVGFIIFIAPDKILYTIIIIQILNSMLDISFLYTGLEKFGTVAIRTLFIKIVYFVAIVTFVREPDDFYKYCIIESLGVCGVSISLFIRLPHLLTRFKGKLNIKRHLVPVLTLFVPSIAVQIYTVLDKSMIGLLSGGVYAENGYYELSQTLVKGGIMLVTTLASVSAPRIAYELGRNNMHIVKKQMYDSYRFAWFSVIPVIVVMYFIVPRVVPLFYGPGYDKVSILARVLLPILLAMGLSTISGSQYLVPAKKVRYYNIALIIGAVVNFFMNLILIPKLMSVGASIGSVVAEFCVLITELIFISKIGLLRIRRILRYGISYVIAGIVTGIALMYLDEYIPCTVFGVLIDILAGLFIYIAFLLIIHDRLVIDGIWKFFHKVRENKEAEELSE